VVYIKLFLTALFWGGTFIAGRQVARDLGHSASRFCGLPWHPFCC
jgi:hypothetical protein